MKIGIGSGRWGVGKERRGLPGVWIWRCLVGVKSVGVDDDDGPAVVVGEYDGEDLDSDRFASSMSSPSGFIPACSVYGGSVGALRETSDLSVGRRYGGATDVILTYLARELVNGTMIEEKLLVVVCIYSYSLSW